MEEADLVIFYGPPHSGKTSFYERNLSKFARVEPILEFQKNPSFSLRQLIISKIVSRLKQGEKVVIDDENESYVKRDSYISLIKKTFPDCKILCITFHAKHGREQLLWNREYAFGQAVREKLKNVKMKDAALNFNMKKSDRLIQKWMEEIDQLEPPRSTEGYWKIEKVTTTLVIKSKYMFEVPGLFIQWEGLFDASNHALLPKAPEALSAWYKNNACGRIIIVCDRSPLSTDSSDKDSQMQVVLKTLSDKLPNCPVYLITVRNQDESGEYSVPPCPGLLIFLQKLHCLNFSNKGTVYVHKTSPHMKMAEECGIQHIKASKFFSHPDSAGNTHSYTSVLMPVLIRQQKVVMDNGDVGSPAIPLFYVMRVDQTICSAELGCGRCLYLAVKNQDVLQKYQNEYQENASLSTDKDSKIELLNKKEPPLSGAHKCTREKSLRGLPEWMKKGSKRKSGSTSANLHNVDKSKNKKRNKEVSYSDTIYLMTEEELKDVATEIIKERGESVSLFRADQNVGEKGPLSELMLAEGSSERAASDVNTSNIDQTVKDKTPKQDKSLSKRNPVKPHHLDILDEILEGLGN